MAKKRNTPQTKPVSGDLWLPHLPDYRQKWLCMWQDNDGLYIANQKGEYMCAESWQAGDPAIESKMRAAAKSYGVEGGRPVWIKGRKVSDMESDDQMERLLEGKIPDEREAALVEIEEQYRRKHGLN